LGAIATRRTGTPGAPMAELAVSVFGTWRAHFTDPGFAAHTSWEVATLAGRLGDVPRPEGRSPVTGNGTL